MLGAICLVPHVLGLRDSVPAQVYLHSCLLDQLVIYFSETKTIGTKRSQNGILKKAQSHTNQFKTLHQNTPTVKTCKKSASGKCKTSKNDGVLYFHYILQRPRLPKKDSRCLPKWSLWENLKKTRKQSTQKNIKNTTLQKSDFGCKMTSK